jgi:hypothetical protein
MDLSPELLDVLLASAAGGGGISGLFKLYESWKKGKQDAVTQSAKDKRDDFDTIIEDYREELEAYKKRLADERAECAKEREICERDRKESRREVEILNLRVSGLEVSNGDLPFPKWTVSLDGKYLAVNTMFIQRFLTPSGKVASDVIGKTHAEVWSAETALRLSDLDKAAIISASRQARADHFKFDDHITGNFTVFKYAVFKGALHFGYEGIAIDI